MTCYRAYYWLLGGCLPKVLVLVPDRTNENVCPLKLSLKFGHLQLAPLVHKTAMHYFSVGDPEILMVASAAKMKRSEIFF